MASDWWVATDRQARSVAYWYARTWRVLASASGRWTLECEKGDCMATLPSRIRRLTLLLIGIVLGLTAAAPAAAGKPGPPPTTRIVCVDAGHGLGDTGAAYGGFEERALTLDIAERLQTLL